MAKEYSELGALKSALLKEITMAVQEATDKAMQLLQRNVSEFYSIPEGKYHRTGMLEQSPHIDGFAETGNGAISQISISTRMQYDPSGRDTETIYGYAEDGGLIGKGGFWKRTEAEMQNILDDAIKKRFK